MHFFEPRYAKKYGVNAAIILQNIIFWSEKKQANSQAADDGLFYIYNSVNAWNDLFPYLTPSAIRTALKKLEDEKVIVSRNDLNKMGYDRTKHYAVSFAFFEKCICKKSQMDLPENTNGFVGNRKPIPDINTDNKPDSKQEVIQPAKADFANEVFAYWCEVMDKNPNSSKLTPKRAKAIKARLDDGYSIDDIKKAILGCSQDKFSMGENDRKKPFNDIELICRTGDKLESFRDSYRPVKQQKQIQEQPVQSTKLDSLSAEEQEKERQEAQALIDQLGAL